MAGPNDLIRKLEDKYEVYVQVQDGTEFIGSFPTFEEAVDEFRKGSSVLNNYIPTLDKVTYFDINLQKRSTVGVVIEELEAADEVTPHVPLNWPVDSKHDMLIGPCACGAWHRLEDWEVRLAGSTPPTEEKMNLEIPEYWLQATKQWMAEKIRDVTGKAVDGKPFCPVHKVNHDAQQAEWNDRCINCGRTRPEHRDQMKIDD